MLKQSLNLKLTQKLSPQQIQLMKLIQLPTLAFEQKLKEEIEENPALEGKEGKEDLGNEHNEEEFDGESIDTSDINIDEYLSDDEIPSYKIKDNNYSADDEEKQIPYAGGTTFHQHLIHQLNTFKLDQENKQIALFLIGSLDESGYLRRPIIDLVDDLAFTENLYTDEKTVEKNLVKIVQQLEPVGVGARDLAECLILQLKNQKNSLGQLNAIDILENSFDLFIKKHFEKIIAKHQIDEELLKAAIQSIEKLNPKPGNSIQQSSRIVEQIVPDFNIQIEEGALVLTLNSRNAPELFVSNTYQNMLKGYQESNKKNKSQKKLYCLSNRN